MRTLPDDSETSTASVVLLWVPVGAGGHVVARTSGWWERVHAALAGRGPQILLHAALEISVADAGYVIEMAPQWSGPRTDRGVVAVGPVGLGWLGRWTLFRYEVRCWRGGTIPDRRWAVGDPIVLPTTAAAAELMLRRIRDVPTLTWGRVPPGAGEMWNSNSVVSWLLTVGGIRTDAIEPPAGARAPGWFAGLAVAAAGTTRTSEIGARSRGRRRR